MKKSVSLRDELRETASDAKRKKLRQASEAGRGLHRIAAPAGMDDSGGRSGHPARIASAGAAGWRPFRDLRSQRSLSPRHQPQQPLEAPDRIARARHHRAQRKAHAAGSRRRAVRQRPPRPRHHRRQQAAAEVAVRYAEGQAGPLPSEPARQARRLFGPLGHRRRAGTQAASVRAAEEDGARAVQAVHLCEARALRHGLHRSRRRSAWSRKNGRKFGIFSKR